MKFPILCRLVLSLPAFLSIACATPVPASGYGSRNDARAELAAALDSALSRAKGQVGVALVTSQGDTLVAGADVHFPLMSVFKLHESIAVARTLDSRGQNLDTLLCVSRYELNPDTWSPMLEDYPEGDISLTVSDLMAYMLIHSDNNASNILFDRIVSVAGADSLVRTLIPRCDFSLRHTEAEMSRNHDLAYENWSTPLACAVLIDRVFTDSLVSAPAQESIRGWLGQCRSAPGRIAAAFQGDTGARLYHRTGSGFTNSRGEIAAVNDVAWVSLPDGSHYALAILVKDYPGTQAEADRQIGSIAARLHRRLAAHGSR